MCKNSLVVLWCSMSIPHSLVSCPHISSIIIFLNLLVSLERKTPWSFAQILITSYKRSKLCILIAPSALFPVHQRLVLIVVGFSSWFSRIPNRSRNQEINVTGTVLDAFMMNDISTNPDLVSFLIFDAEGGMLLMLTPKRTESWLNQNMTQSRFVQVKYKSIM